MKKSFLDTNIFVAMVFYLNSLHLKSKNVFEAYSHYYWSSYVHDEFDKRCIQKLDNLSNFFFDLQKFLENPNKGGRPIIE